MTRPTGLLVVGELCPDIVVTGVPTRGRELSFGQAEELVTATGMVLGSSAGITACAAAAAGVAKVRLLAVVGRDPMGEMCREWLAERGVDTTWVRTDPAASTGSSVVLVRADDPSDREILTHLGAMARLTPEDVTDEALADVSHLHVSSFFLHVNARDRLHETLQRARAAGLTVSLDTNHDPAGEWRAGAQGAIAASDVLFVNDSEALGLSGLGSDGSPDDAVRRLLALMPTGRPDQRFPAVVHKRGPRGATVHSPSTRVHVAAPQVRVVDTIGAGDTLAGTALSLLARGADWPTVLRHAVAAGSLSTQAAGGTAGHRATAQIADLADTLPVHADPPPASKDTT